MTYEFETTVADFAAVQRDISMDAKTGQTLWEITSGMGWRWLAVCLPLFAAGLTALILDWMGIYSVPGALTAFLMIIGGFGCWFGATMLLNARAGKRGQESSPQLLETYARSPLLHNYGGPTRLTITPKYVEMETRTELTRSRWEGVNALIEGPQHIHFRTPGGGCISLPKRAMSADELALLLSTIRPWIRPPTPGSAAALSAAPVTVPIANSAPYIGP